jgi:hypothetical protein
MRAVRSINYRRLTMRKSLIAMCLALRLTANAEAAGYQTAMLLEAESYTERATAGWVREGNGGTFSMNHDMNRVTVSLGGLRVTGVFEAHWAKSPRASDFVVGTAVQAMIEGDRLLIAVPDSKPIKARIVRRELES